MDDEQEDGSGAGGYAKEMSKEWFEAAERMLAAEMKGIDVVIGTALIPGRAAPRLITEVNIYIYMLYIYIYMYMRVLSVKAYSKYRVYTLYNIGAGR